MTQLGQAIHKTLFGVLVIYPIVIVVCCLLVMFGRLIQLHKPFSKEQLKAFA